MSKPEQPNNKRKKRKIPPQWHVLLHNDDHNQVEYVISKIMQIVKLSREDAQKKIEEIGENHKAVLITTHLELAELYVEQFTNAKLTATLQKATT